VKLDNDSEKEGEWGKTEAEGRREGEREGGREGLSSLSSNFEF